MNQKVIVNYRTKKTHCPCCEQKLEIAKVSTVKEIEFTKETALNWVNWNEVAEYPEDMESMIPEFIHETILFWAETSDGKIIFEDSEIEKVKEFILREVVEEAIA